MNSRILIIVDSIDVNDSSGSKANVALIKNLATIGYAITVYHYTQKDIQLQGTTCISIREKKYTPLYFLSRTQRIIQRYFKVNLAIHLEPIFGFSFTYFNDVNSIKAVLKKLAVSKFDLVLTLSKGASFRPHYAILKSSQFHNKWLAYVHDPYPFHYYPRPYNWVEPGFKRKELFFKKVSEKAKYSGFPSLLLKDWMGSYFPNFINTGLIIPHQKMNTDEKDMKTPSFFISTKFNLLHAGNLMKPRSPKGLIIGFKIFLNKHPEAKEKACLYLIGEASYHKKLLAGYESILPELKVISNNIPFESVYAIQKKASVNIILEAKSEISPFLPGKFPHCIAAQKPILILGPYFSEVRRLLGSEYKYWSEIDDSETIAIKIEELYYNWRKNSNNLDYNSLNDYLSVNHLKKIFSSL